VTAFEKRNEFVIRGVRSDDLDRVAEIEAICFPPSEAASRSSFAGRIAAFPDCFLIGEREGLAVGYVNGCATDSETIRDEFFHDTAHHNPQGRNLSIFGLAVVPELRGLGVGATLMKRFIELARSTGREGVILTCKENLVAYYESFGFLNLGLSKSSHGGAQWFDMRLQL
jgi:ribosomal protein S18 acetylase RimI-like enzyme